MATLVLISNLPSHCLGVRFGFVGDALRSFECGAALEV
jgi:hypothetical protein